MRKQFPVEDSDLIVFLFLQDTVRRLQLESVDLSSRVKIHRRMNLQILASSLALVSTQAAWFCFAKFSPSFDWTWRLGLRWTSGRIYIWRADPPGLQIHFWTDDDAWNMLFPTKINYFVINNLYHVEGISGVDRVDENISMDSNNVFRAEERVFILEIKVSWIRVLLTAGDRIRLTWPAVSMISHSNSVPLYLTVFWKLLSIVG